MTLEEAREFFKMDRFAVYTGIEIAEVGPNYARCTLQIEDKHLAAHNGVMGGAIFTLADFTFAVASNDGQRFTVTSNSNISYLAAAQGSSLTAECTCIKDGKRLCYFQTVVSDENGRQVAIVTSTGMHI